MAQGEFTERVHPFPLLERERELEVLSSAVAQAREGVGSLLIVEGPAGIGKTSVLHQAAALGEEAGCLVRTARGGEMERDMPFGVVRQLFEPLIERASEEERKSWLLGAARQALTALATSDEHRTQTTDPFAVINGLYWLVANLASAQPVVLIIDDAQWSDAASLRFGVFLARRLSDLPVALIFGVRTGEAREPSEIQALRVEATALHPQALSNSSVHELIARRTGAIPSIEFSEACAAASSGNPLFVIEILRELDSEGRTLDSDAAASVATIAPDSIGRKVLFRLGRFGDEAVAMANVIAVLGRSPQLRHAAQLAGLDEDTARKICDELRGAEILAPGLPIEFVHPVVRQAIYREQPEEQRSVAHRRAAEILHSTGADAQEVAAHLLACAPNGDQWVVDRLEDAARVAISEGAYDGAVTYLDRALLEPPHDDLPLLDLLGIALVETDVFRAAQILPDVAKRTSDRDLRVEVLRRLVAAYIRTGNLIAAATTCDEAIEAAAGQVDQELLFDLEAQRYQMVKASGSGDASTTARIEALAADLEGKTPGERIARQALAMDRFMRCTSIEEVIAVALPFPDNLPWEFAGIQSPIPMVTAKILGWMGRWQDAREPLAKWTEAMHERSKLLLTSIGNSWLAEVDRLSGRLHESEAEATTAWDIASISEGFSTFGWSAWMNLAATLLARGNVEGLRQLIGDFDLSEGPGQVPLNPWPIEVRAHLRLAEGDLEAAAQDFSELGEGLEEVLGWLNPSYPAWRQEAAEALAALGRTAEANHLLSVAEERAHIFGAPHAIASVLRAKATIEPRGRAIRTLRESIELYEESGPPHELGRSLMALGTVLRNAGDRSEARTILGRALEVAAGCGAEGLERKVRDELAAAGSRPRRAALTGVGALTASELKTAKLAAAGLTNSEIAERLFVTVRTVETHLTHAYDKLMIPGRRKLVEALADHSS